MREVLNETPYVTDYERRSVGEGVVLYRGTAKTKTGTSFRFAVLAGPDAAGKVETLDVPFLPGVSRYQASAPAESENVLFIADTVSISNKKDRLEAYRTEIDLESRLFRTME